MLKKPWVYAVSLLVVGTMLGWFGKGFAASGAPLPGSEGDPLVTKAYVDKKLSMKVVELLPGEVLLGFSGTRIILRSGKATVIDSELGGLCDVTQGIDARKGDIVLANHLLLVPRDDGRGIKAATDVIVMVQGDFAIE